MRPYQAFHVLEAVRNSFSRPLYREGIGLSPDDTQTVLDVYQQWLHLMLDLGYLSPNSLERDATRLWTDMVQKDVFSLNNAFAECLARVRVQERKGFKGLCSMISNHLYHLIKDDIDVVMEGDVLAARRLVQLFSYTSRLSLQDLDLTQQLLQDYLRIEEGIPTSNPSVLTDALNKIIKRWIAPFAPIEDICPKHGPGGVAGHGRCSLEVKYKDLTSDELTRYAFGSPAYSHQIIKSHLSRVSQTIFVPKSYKTFRTISMEPTTLQYYQQGVWNAIDQLVSRKSVKSYMIRGRLSKFESRKMKTSKYLVNHIGFHDAERNKRLAQQGSAMRDYATIDLSSASDSVGYDLVKCVFRGTWLLKYLVACRSTHTFLPDGRMIKLKKFAPMGSSLCFPIETLIFASICEHVTRNHGVPGDYTVYGDDIIVPTQCVSDVFGILERLGFLVNTSKSFFDPQCWFRESCGGEYCNGYDVTPMRISRKYASKELLVATQKLVDLANTAYQKGYLSLRYFFIEKLRNRGYIPLFAPTALLSSSYSNYHTRVRWRKDLQRIECQVSSLFVKPTETHCDESIRLRHWYESTHQRKSLGDGFVSVTSGHTVAVRKTWAAKPYEVSDYDFIASHLK